MWPQYLHNWATPCNNHLQANYFLIKKRLGYNVYRINRPWYPCYLQGWCLRREKATHKTILSETFMSFLFPRRETCSTNLYSSGDSDTRGLTRDSSSSSRWAHGNYQAVSSATLCFLFLIISPILKLQVSWLLQDSSCAISESFYLLTNQQRQMVLLLIGLNVFHSW